MSNAQGDSAVPEFGAHCHGWRASEECQQGQSGLCPLPWEPSLVVAPSGLSGCCFLFLYLSLWALSPTCPFYTDIPPRSTGLNEYVKRQVLKLSVGTVSGSRFYPWCWYRAGITTVLNGPVRCSRILASSPSHSPAPGGCDPGVQALGHQGIQ